MKKARLSKTGGLTTEKSHKKHWTGSHVQKRSQYYNCKNSRHILDRTALREI